MKSIRKFEFDFNYKSRISNITFLFRSISEISIYSVNYKFMLSILLSLNLDKITNTKISTVRII